MKQFLLCIFAFSSILLIYAVVAKRPEFEWLILIAIVLCTYSLHHCFIEKETPIKKQRVQSIVYKPARRRYLFLLLLSVCITLGGVFANPKSPWLTIITGIGTGGIASVAVAWLIEEANCEEKEKRSNEIYGVLVTSLELFAYSYACMYQVLREGQERDKRHTWLEWKDLLISWLNDTTEKDIPESLKHVFDFSYRETTEELQFVLNQRLQLIADGLMTSEMCFSFQGINQKLELCETVVNKGTCKEFAFHLSSLAMSLEMVFEKNHTLRHINRISFSDLVEFDEEARRYEIE